MRTVLVAEDNPQLQKLLAIHLRASGYEVIPAADGAEALAKARLGRPDCVVSDVLMPRLDGFKLCRALREDQELRAVPVVLISSGVIEDADRELAREAGADRYVARTPDCAAVLCALEQVLKPSAEPASQAAGGDALPGLRRRFLTGGLVECRGLLDAAVRGSLDGAAARGVLHRWAGVGGTLGFPQISQLAYQLELQLSQPASSWPDLRPALADLEALLQAALRRLPAADVPPGPDEPAPPPGLPAQVVVADDDFTVATLVASILRKHDIGCVIARHGREALQAVRDLKPEVLVLDINMPGIDGFEVLMSLKRDRALCATAVVMLTARQREADVLRGFGLGADDYVVKPFGPMELVARVKRLLRPGLTLAERSTCAAG